MPAWRSHPCLRAWSRRANWDWDWPCISRWLVSTITCPFTGWNNSFRNGTGSSIPRQQMVQWVEKIAFWLQPIYDAMWAAMQPGGYLQVDETPVKVLDPEVKGKAARGYLWFYAVPGGDVVLEFNRSRGLDRRQRTAEGLRRYDPNGCL